MRQFISSVAQDPVLRIFWILHFAQNANEQHGIQWLDHEATGANRIFASLGMPR